MLPRQKESEQFEAAGTILQPAAVIKGHVLIVLRLDSRTKREKVAAPLNISGHRSCCLLVVVPGLLRYLHHGNVYVSAAFSVVVQ